MKSLQFLMRAKYSLRVVFVALSVSCVLLGVFVRIGYPSRREARAIDEILARGATIEFAPHSHSSIACTLLGCQYAGSAESIDFSRAEFRDDDVDLLGHTPHLYSCNFSGSALTDAGVLNITQLMSHRHLPKLRSLDLSGTRITDDGVMALLGVDQLLYLNLNETSVGDHGLKGMRACRRLVWVSLSDTCITDDGLESLSCGPPLVAVSVNRTNVSDRGLHFLSRCTHLQYLEVRGCSVSLLGLKGICSLKDLRRLDVSDTNVRGDELQELGREFPRTEIIHANLN